MNDRDEFIAWLIDKYPLLSSATCARLLEYGGHLAEAAGRMNLVAPADLPRLYRRHLAESISPALAEAFPMGARVLDVGTGGGLPGIPLAIVRPDLQITLLEAREKKLAFLERVVLLLALDNATVRAGSLEELVPRTGLWEMAVARGVAWSRTMIQGLERCLTAEGWVARFGAPDPLPEGVRSSPVDEDGIRVVQFWPRATWAGLVTAP